MRYITIILCSLILMSFSPKDDYSVIKDNYKKNLLFEEEEYLIEVLTTMPKEEYVSDQVIVELMDRYPISNIKNLMGSLKENGSWNDIDYASQDRSGWKPKIHTERILLMARAYNIKTHEYYKSEELLKTIHKTLDYWFQAKLKCPNWWYNQIGVPKTLGAVAILMEDVLTKEEKTGLIEILKQSKIGMTGQNKIWLSGNVLVRALLEKNNELVREARDSIVSGLVMGLGKDEGIKTDWSFHQHGAQQQFGNYGMSYFSNMSFWAKVFSGTSFAFGQTQLDLLSDLLKNGFDRVIWKGYLDVNGLGRQFFKQVQRHKALSLAISANMLVKVDSKNAQLYKNFIEEVIHPKEKSTNLGVHHFWQSDQTVNITPNWMSSLKMSSHRVIGAEGGNGDNKKGYYLADGALYTYINGDEYFDITPNWNWRKIPGITTYQEDSAFKELAWLGGKNKSNFVGNVNNGKYGFTVMDLNRDGVKAKKTWVFSPKYMLCSGTGINSDVPHPVNTTIEQSIKKGELLYLDGENWHPITAEKEFIGEQRFFHNNIGYVVLGNSKSVASVEKRTDSWYDVMNTYPKNYMATNNVVSIWIDHGIQPKNADYRYLILPNITKEELKAFNLNFLNNRNNISNIINISEEKLFYFFETPFTYEYSTGKSGSFKVKSSEGGLFMLSKENNEWKLYYSDPTQQLEEVNFVFDGKSKKIILPQGEYKGTTIQVF